MKILKILCLFYLSALVATAQSSNEIQTKGKVCPSPVSACGNSFEDNDLSFHLPSKLIWQRNYYSADFYAVILKSRAAVQDRNVDDDRCSQGYFAESERKKIQLLFLNNKVFASRNGCYMPRVWYDGANNQYEFIAVYAGESKTQADAFLNQVRRRKEFSDANSRKMKVVYGYGD